MHETTTTLGLNYVVKERHEEEFIEMAKRVVEILKANPGHIKTDLSRSVFEPRTYTIFSEWTNREALHDFTKSDAFKQTTAWGAGILEGRPNHRVYESR